MAHNAAENIAFSTTHKAKWATFTHPALSALEMESPKSNRNFSITTEEE